MPFTNSPNGGIVTSRKARWTSYEGDGSTQVDADLPKGACVQLLGGFTSGSALANAAGTTIADDGYAFGRPASGNNGPFAIVREDVMAWNLTQINTETTSGVRDGGHFPAVVSGITRARVKANCTKNVTLLVPENDSFDLVPYLASGLFSQSLAAGTALSNTVSTEQNFAGAGATVTIPANSLKVGDVIRGQVQGIRTAVNTDTLTVRVKIGSNVIALSGAVVGAVNDIFVINYTIVVRTIGASGTAVAYSTSFNGTSGAAAGAAEIPTGSAVASFALDTTAATTIQVTAQYNGTTATNTANLEAHNVWIDRLDTSMGSKPFAIALETVDNSSAAALTTVLILQSPY